MSCDNFMLGKSYLVEMWTNEVHIYEKLTDCVAREFNFWLY